MRQTTLAVLLAVVLACGGSTPTEGGASGSYPAGTWTWVDVAGTACSDGSTTGFAVNRGDQPDVVFFMNGGGACWDARTCGAPAPTATPGPFQGLQFAIVQPALAGTFLDRAAPGNPFAHWTYVFIPYCTGDLHAGDNVVTYSSTTAWHHVGRRNVAADLATIAPAFAGTRRLVVGGSSAGGYGSLLQYDAIRAAFGAQATSLIDDSGPPLQGDALDPALRTAWVTEWNLAPLLAQVCPGAACQDDFSLIIPQLAGRYPQDRMALLSSLQDATMRGYFGLTAEQFQAALLATVQDRIAPLPAFHAFLVPGQDHALLARATSYTAGGTALPTWLAQMIGGDPAWGPAGP